MNVKHDFEAWKIWDLREVDILGNPLDPNHIRGPEVHPDLIRHKGWFYCQFNVEGGKRMIRSPDGQRWETVQLGRSGQMFSLTPWGDLMTVGTSRLLKIKPDGKWLRQSHTQFSSDGVAWTFAFHSPETLDKIFYTVRWRGDMAYSVAYGLSDQGGTLYRSPNARDWELVKADFFPEGRGGNEGDLIFDDDGTAYCLLRGPYKTPVTIGVSKDPDYKHWEWRVPEVDWFGDGATRSADDAIAAPLGGPKWIRLADGRLVAYGRVLGPDTTERNALAEGAARAGGDKNDATGSDAHAIVTLLVFDPENTLLTRLVDFPGFTHYHGVVEHDGHLWIACGRCDNAWETWMLRIPTPQA